MKTKLMKRAHQIAKNLEGDYRARMSLALRQAWREEKKVELVKLTGTEKQIAWAEEIRKVNISYLQDSLKDFELRAARGDDFPEIRATLQKAIEGLMAQPTEAKWWIEHRRVAWAIEQRIILAHKHKNQ
jgi:hypothetical protein